MASTLAEFYVSMLLTALSNVLIVSSLSLPIVDPGLFVIQGVSTCGLGSGYCLLSNSCLVDTDFESDSDGGHCDGLKHAFTPNANFVCCKYLPPSTTLSSTTLESDVEDSTAVVVTTPPPPKAPAPALESVTFTPNETDGAGKKTEQVTTTAAPTTTTTTTTTRVPITSKTRISPFNIAANTNKILNGIQHLLQGGRMRPSVALQKFNQGNTELVYNDKSLVNLILLGLNNSTAGRALIN